MSDDQIIADSTAADVPEVVDTPPAPPADNAAAPAEQTAPEEQAPAADTPPAPPADEGSAVEQAPADTPAADESRTEFVSGVRAGDACVCPDGRTGTVHKFDEGLVCIPNADQG